MQAEEFELLSKDDARAMFAMTRAQWISNVQAAASAGSARALGTPQDISMIMSKPDWDLVVKPGYRGNEPKPDIIQVTVAYRDPKVAEILTDAVIGSLTQQAKKQLAPEFEVHANAERIQDRVVIFFLISQKK